MRVVAFCKAERATVACFESYAFGLRTSAHALGELGGVVRLELVRAGIEIRTVNMGSARKFLLGRVPRADAKIAVELALRAAGATFTTADEFDAMCIANLALADAGAYCLAQPEAA